ncbi:glutaredoxin family protein [soil metagenome]
MDKNITIYSTPTCHFCHMAKDFLTENNVAFTDYDVQTSLEKRQEMIEKSGQMGVPVIFVGDEMMIGFDKQKLASLAGIAS